MSLKAWEDKDTEKLIDLYVNRKEQDVHKLAKVFNKGYRSVISKLVQLKIYEKPINTIEKAPTVKMMVLEIEGMFGIQLNGYNLNNKQNLTILLKELKKRYCSD